MAAKKKKKAGSKAGYDLAVSMLKRNPKVEYADVKAAADKKGVAIYPIVYGRAKAALGLVAVAKRGQGKAKQAAKKRAARASARKGVARRSTRRAPRRSGASASGIESIVAQIKETERDRDRAIQALVKIRDIIDSAV